MEGTGGAGVDAALLEGLARRAEAIRLPPPDLPGWSSVCATEYRLCVLGLRVELAGLRLALAAAAASVAR